MTVLRLQFADEPRWYAPVIRWFTHSDYCHVDIVDDDGTLIGARPIGGVARRPSNYLPFRRVLIVTVPLTDDGYRAARAFLDRQMGKPYDYSAFAAFAVARDWREDDRWFCSELVTAVLEAGGAFAHPLCAPKEKITPGDLRLVLSAIGAT